MQVQHKAFLDLENGLTRRVLAGWQKLWTPTREELRDAVLHHDWTQAARIVDRFSTDALIVSNAQFAQTIALSSLLLGASRLTLVRSSQIAKAPPLQQLGNGVTQWGFIVGRNAARYVRRTLHLGLDALAREAEQRRQIVRKEAAESEVEELLDATGQTGADFTSLASSLLVSRMSTFGFLTEAADQGLEYYEISEVLDDHTCGVCRIMDGQVFPLAAGIAQATSIMGAEDPDSLSAVAPWPSQSKDSLSRLGGASTQDLVDAGLPLPPYHAGCRGIVVAAGHESAGTTAAGAQTAARGAGLSPMSLAALGAALGLVVGKPHATDTTLEVASGDEPDDESDEEAEWEEEQQQQRAEEKKREKEAQAAQT